MRCRADTVTEAMPGFFDSAALFLCDVGERDEGAVLGVEFRWVYGSDRALFESVMWGGGSEADDNC